MQSPSPLPQYNLLHKLHEGSDTVIYRAVREQDARPVVIKMPREELPGPRVLAILRHEYSVLQSIELPGVLRAHALEAVGPSLALVVEDFGGASLDLLMRAGRVPLELVLHIGVEVADALDALHRLPLLHKDIKPHNIVMEPATRRVKLIDFSISTRLSHEPQRMTSAGELEGTLAYMAPEQTGRMNRSVDARSDLYSLGVTLYELLTGSLPFAADDPLELVHSHLARTPVPPARRAADVPEIVSDIVMKLLAKDPQDRYQTASGLRADLARCADELRARGAVAVFPLASSDRSGVLRIPEKLYGRRDEVAALLAAFERVEHGSAELLLICGYSGAGKSSLVHEVQRPIARRGAIFAAGKCDQYERAVPYAPVTQALRELCRTLLTAPAEALGRWRDALTAAFGSNGRLLIDLIPELELIVGPQPAVPTLGPTEAQNRFDLVFTAMLRVFAAPEHPLVVFIDDLQWADPATLRLLPVILADPECTHLLLIGAYRDNEVGDGHPLRGALDELRRCDVGVQEARLGPLTPDDVAELLADTLGTPHTRVTALADVILEKTQGNPFFLGQFLQLLAEDGLLRWSSDGGGWSWNDADVRARDVTANVVEFVAAKIRRLSEPAQRLLQRAACIGHRFDWETLRAIDARPVEQASAALWEALREGFILPLDAAYRFIHAGERVLADDVGARSAYRFLHDRVQQAAYALLGDEREATHLRIGRYLRDRDPGQIPEEMLFEVANHLHHAQAMIVGDERRELARIHLQAGRRARAGTAFHAARHYFHAAVECLDADAWDVAYDLAFAATIELAEAEYLTGAFAEADARFESALARARTRSERAQIYNLRVLLYAAMGKFPELFAAGRAGLALFGVELPRDPAAQQQAVEGGLAEAQVNLRGRTTADLLAEPLSYEPDATTVMRLLASMSGPAFVSDPGMFGVIVVRMVNVALRDGLVEGSDYAFTVYGLVLSGARDLALAYQYGELGAHINARTGQRSTRCMVHFLLGNLAALVKPLQAVVPLLDSSRHAALEVGNFAYLSFYCIQRAVLLLISGDPLAEGLATIDDLTGVVRRTRDATATAVVDLVRQALHNLTGATATSSLDGPGFSEARFLADNAQATLAQWVYWVIRMRLAFLYGELDAARDLEARARALYDLGVGRGHFYDSEQLAYSGLIAAALHAGADEAGRAALASRLAAMREGLTKWAESNPSQHQAMFHLLAAEAARIDGRVYEATGLYEQATTEARDRGLVLHTALAAELAGRFHHERGRRSFAVAYLQEAHHEYLRWGAAAKARQLVERYPQLLGASGSTPAQQGTGRAGATATRRSGGHLLEIDGVLRAAQAIAGEIVLDRVLDRLMRIVMMHAGAQRGFLLMAQRERWVVAAEMQTEPDVVRIGGAEAIGSDSPLATSVVHYVARSREGLLLGDASVETRFAADPYIAERRPRSLLCLPLRHQGRLAGIVYLENNAAPDAFTPDRVEVLQLLSAQAAIALENAQLYADVQQARNELQEANAALDRQVRERTRDLNTLAERLSAVNVDLVHQSEDLRRANEQLQLEISERARTEQARASLQEQVLRAQDERLAEMAAPLIPITDRVVAMPLIGTMDGRRATQVLETALVGATRMRAQVMILDVTGLRGLDREAAVMLVRTASALRLIGTEAVLTGLRSEMAALLAEEGMGLGALRTLGTLQAGIAHALGRTGDDPRRRA